ncbi:MAG: hypothetical protein LBU70_08705, partial [Chitinispirillales bacterium]|nr:hypothetical protein [Chitinispirillales bacterium]
PQLVYLAVRQSPYVILSLGIAGQARNDGGGWALAMTDFETAPCHMIERGNFEPLSPKKNLILKTLKALILFFDDNVSPE